jgi:hypothetical protein
MKLCHVAALALVGWYLMLPPPSFHKDTSLPPSPDSEAVLSKWSTVGTSNTVGECKTEMARRQRQAERAENTKVEKSWKGAFLCIASDDPRLKVK